MDRKIEPQARRPGLFERLLSYRRLNRRSARFFAFTIIENGSRGFTDADLDDAVPPPSRARADLSSRLHAASSRLHAAAGYPMV
jgi:hypothetical protein